MWDNLRRVVWARHTHAYGPARDAPAILRNMIAPDDKARAKGWDAFWGSLNHQGDYYDSTVAAIPFLIEAVRDPRTPERANILRYFRDRWLDAPNYGGDPFVPEPPGGVDVSTPLLTDAEFASLDLLSPVESEVEYSEEEFDRVTYRRMDLCAWQTARAIQAGIPTFLKLLDDPDRKVASAAAGLLLPWLETRARAKAALIRTIVEEENPVEQARRILEFGVYGSSEDAGTLVEWVAPHQPTLVRAAAALVWAWVADPAPIPALAAEAIQALSIPSSDAFGKLPWVGVYQRGPWRLPTNAADLILRLADNEDKELRWRAVQGLAMNHEAARRLSPFRVIPVLLKAMSDDYNRIRAAAALALSQRGDQVFEVAPDAIPLLIGALEEHKSRNWGDTFTGLDSDASICGHAARLLATSSRRLTDGQRNEALSGIDRADRRYAGRGNDYVSFPGMSVPATPFLKKQREFVLKPKEWNLDDLFSVIAFPDMEDRRLPPDECDRRLADAYSNNPEQTIAAAIQIIRQGSDRAAAIGAAHWLMTLGPAAHSAVEALEEMARGKLDSHAQEQAREASKFIRQSILVTPDAEVETTDGGPSARRGIAQFLRAVSETNPSEDHQEAIVEELKGLLEHPDLYVRASALDGLTLLRPTSSQVDSVLIAIERLLADEAFAEVGIFGEYNCEGRLFHWRQERRSPRGSAIHTLFALGRIPEGGRSLTAMLAESAHPKVVCGKSAEPHRFPIAHWRRAVDAAGGLSMAEPLIRAARQHCRNQQWPGNNGPFVCEAELADIVRQLSGRLAP